MNRVPQIILERAIELRRVPTRVESLMRDFIPLLGKLYGLRITFQQPLELWPSEWCIADWYEWHSLSCFEYDGAGHVDPIQRAKDHRRDELLRMGIPSIKVIRFKNEEAITDAFGVAHSIARICLTRLGREHEASPPGRVRIPLRLFHLREAGIASSHLSPRSHNEIPRWTNRIQQG